MSVPPLHRYNPGAPATLSGILTIALLVLLAPAAAQAQHPGQGCPGGWHCPPPTPAGHGWDDHARIMGYNAAIGAFTAGLRSHARGEPFWPAFLKGAGGGAIVYGGKRLSADHAWGAGLAGRQIAAVGASVVRNAAEGDGLFDRLLVPLGPVRLYVDPRATNPVHARIDLIGSVVLLHHATRAGSRFDADASLSAGTAVFHTAAPDRPGWHGSNTAGVILLRDDGDGGTFRPQSAGAIPPELVFAHERIHLLQYDQAIHTWGAPIERALLPRVPGGKRLVRYFDVGLIMVPVVVINALMDYHARPWEKEAHFFTDPPGTFRFH